MPRYVDGFVLPVAKMMNLNAMPFDCKRMVYGGFKTLVEA